jgi:STE24 endopeptidase
MLVAWTGDLSLPGMLRDLALIVAVVTISGIVGLPFSYVSTFVIETKFGFNRMTRALWVADLVKGIVVGAALGLPLAALVLWLMGAAGPLWWIWVWAAWVAFQVLVLALYPTVIAPLFNKFYAAAGSARCDRRLARCGLRIEAPFVMDGSRRLPRQRFSRASDARRHRLLDTLPSDGA